MNARSQTTLNVEGMSCGSCVSHVNKALRQLDGVFEVQVRLREGQVSVVHDAAAAPIELLIEELRELGYPARLTRAA